MFKIFSLAVLVIVGVSPTRGWAAEGAPVESRLWPLSGEINLASSFGEYRSGHLHAGLDIKTYGREGLPCRAVGDGHISRMRAAPDGYGKALYVKLSTGETAVYAHLAEFPPDLEHLLFEAQVTAGQYRVDVHLEPDRFPVASGVVVGYTGSTGTSAPHLHFEVRDESENPINPLSSGWALADGVSPEVKGVTFIPLTRDSRVNGVCRTGDVGMRRVGNGRYVATDTLAIAGRVGLGAYVLDRLNSSSGRLAPYRVELVVEGVLLTSIAFESFGYGHAGEVELAYDMERVRDKGEDYLLLFRRNGETLWNRVFFNDGVIDADVLRSMAGGDRDVYTALVRTVDVAGNVTSALVPFRIAGEGPPPADARGSGGDLAGCYVFENLLSVTPGRVELELPESLRRFADPNGPQRVFTVEEFAESGQGTGSSLVVIVDDLRAYFVAAARGVRISSAVPALGIVITMSDNSLYSDGFVFVSQWNGKATGNGLLAVAPPVRVGPLSLALREPMQLRRPGLQAVDGREAFYRLDERKNRWDYQPSLVSGDTLVGDVESPGVYGAFVDRDPPALAPGVIRNRRSYATGDVVREIVVAIEDAGSGVDDERTVVYVNGEKQIARWDGYSGKMYIQLRGDVVRDPIEVLVTAFDRVGNESRGESQIVLSQVKD